MAFADAGCAVEAVCPGGHPLEHVRAVRRLYPHRALAALQSFRDAIQISGPDLIVPSDDLASRLLHQVHAQEKGQTDVALAIERSLGAPESFPIVEARAKFLGCAEALGIRAPHTVAVQDVAALKRAASELGYPLVLKVDGTSGGYGVRIVRSAVEAENAFRTLHAPPSIARAAKRALIDHDRNLIWPALLRRVAKVNAQAFVEGSDVTSTVACWKGKVLATLDFEVIRKRYDSGPSSVLRWIEVPEMQDAVARLVSELKLSGIVGFDFLLEKGSGAAHLLEINPRSTQVGHMTLGAGRDLPAALCAAASGAELEPAPALTKGDTIALFPQEWMRDPNSPFLRTAFHDVPWAEPDLLQNCLQRGQREHMLKKLQLSAAQPREFSTVPERAVEIPGQPKQGRVRGSGAREKL